MKVLFDHSNPFLLAHGGFQIQILETKTALEEAGIQVEFLRWWDEGQKADLIHYFNAASVGYLKQARKVQIPVVMTTLFTETCNRPDFVLKLQGLITQIILRLPCGEGIKNQLTWRSFGACALNVVGLEAERKVLEEVYGVPRDNILVLPLGLNKKFILPARKIEKGNHLISVGTITARKRSVDLAKIALEAGVPILFVGKPYDSSDPYWREFSTLIDQKNVKHQPHVDSPEELTRLYQNAKGFVLMSCHENWCLAAHEAVACGLPLLLPDQAWSRERFGNEATYFAGKPGPDAEILKRFAFSAKNLPPPRVKLLSWKEAVQPLILAYERLLNFKIS